MLNKTTLLLITLGLFAAPALALAEDPPLECTTTSPGHGRWTITTDGPQVVKCSDLELGAGKCTVITYEIEKNTHKKANVVTTLVQDVEVLYPDSHQVFPPGIGDPVTKAGQFSAHEQAVRFKKYGSHIDSITVVVRGVKVATPTSVVVKFGGLTEACRIAGLGADPAIPAVAPSQMFEVVEGDECTLKLLKNPFTGIVTSAEIIPEMSEPDCNFLNQSSEQMSSQGLPIETIELMTDGQSLGNLRYAEGTTVSGENSCTTLFIGGRLYSWGSPCPDPAQ